MIIQMKYYLKICLLHMANKNIKVKWKSTKDLYLKKLQEGADKINRSFNK